MWFMGHPNIDDEPSSGLAVWFLDIGGHCTWWVAMQSMDGISSQPKPKWPFRIYCTYGGHWRRPRRTLLGAFEAMWVIFSVLAMFWITVVGPMLRADPWEGFNQTRSVQADGGCSRIMSYFVEKWWKLESCLSNWCQTGFIIKTLAAHLVGQWKRECFRCNCFLSNACFPPSPH